MKKVIITVSSITLIFVLCFGVIFFLPTTQAEDVYLITIDNIEVSYDRIIVSGTINESNTSIWSYKGFHYFIKQNRVYIKILKFQEPGKVVFSNIDFFIDIKDDFSDLINDIEIYLVDDENHRVIWKTG